MNMNRPLLRYSPFAFSFMQNSAVVKLAILLQIWKIAENGDWVIFPLWYNQDEIWEAGKAPCTPVREPDMMDTPPI